MNDRTHIFLIAAFCIATLVTLSKADMTVTARRQRDITASARERRVDGSLLQERQRGDNTRRYQFTDDDDSRQMVERSRDAAQARRFSTTLERQRDVERQQTRRNDARRTSERRSVDEDTRDRSVPVNERVDRRLNERSQDERRSLASTAARQLSERRTDSILRITRADSGRVRSEESRQERARRVDSVAIGDASRRRDLREKDLTRTDDRAQNHRFARAMNITDEQGNGGWQTISMSASLATFAILLYMQKTSSKGRRDSIKCE